MARINLRVPQGGRFDTEYLESMNDKIVDKSPLKVLHPRLRD